MTTRRQPFNRRSDLLNPTDFLNIAAMEWDDIPQSAFPDAAFGRVGGRVTGVLNLRAQADRSGQILKELGAGSRLKILDRLDGSDYEVFGRTRRDWLKVDSAGTEGFVAAFYVDPETQIGRVSDRVTTRLRLRAHPQEASEILARLTPGTRLVVLGKEDGDDYAVEGDVRRDWLAVDYNGTRGHVAAFFVDVVAEDDAAGDANAILFTFNPTGASERTARQDGLRGGVTACETMAQTDRARVMRFKDRYIVAARENGLPPALLAAIASRESRGGNALDAEGYGDRGHAFGLMQIDDRSYRADTSEGPFGQAHISQASDILLEKLRRVRDQCPSLTVSAQLQTAVSRYNGGRGRAAPHSDDGDAGAGRHVQRLRRRRLVPRSGSSHARSLARRRRRAKCAKESVLAAGNRPASKIPLARGVGAEQLPGVPNRGGRHWPPTPYARSAAVDRTHIPARLKPAGVRAVAAPLATYDVLEQPGAWSQRHDRFRRHAVAVRHAE